MSQTYTVTGGFTDRSKRHWVYVRGLPGKYEVETPPLEGASVRIMGERAVLANRERV